ncbi:MAG: hypothetical protein ACRD2I_21225 [Vicinamibacterales bacterium]
MRPAAAGDAARADHLSRDRMPWESDADDEPFRVFVFAGVRFATFRRVQEEASAPQLRLVCNHLQ